MPEYRGLLFIGDPHLCSRAPGGRKDDYPRKTLDKFKWCLDYAQREGLLACVLGDLFNDTRERQLWLIGEIAATLAGREVIGIFGNHDILTSDTLTEGQALEVLVRAKLYRLVSEHDFWRGQIAGQKVIVGGTSYGHMLPMSFDPGRGAFVFWMTHHNLHIGDYPGTVEPGLIEGVDMVINGHLHKAYEPVSFGRRRPTIWHNPGNISRNKRGDTGRPQVLRFDFEGAWVPRLVEVPHERYENVFHPRGSGVFDEELPLLEGAERAVRGLSLLRGMGGLPGEGLLGYLDTNRALFDDDVFAKLSDLALKVTENARTR